MFKFCVLVGQEEPVPILWAETGKGDGDGDTVRNGTNGFDGDPKGDAAL